MADDEELYEKVAAELAAGEVRVGLWTKALAESGGGDETHTRAAYIRLRVDQLAAVVSAEQARKEQALLKRWLNDAVRDVVGVAVVIGLGVALLVFIVKACVG